jgi:Family of unknown function (DUF5522)
MDRPDLGKRLPPDHPSYAAIVAAHDAAVRAGDDTYLDPDTCYAVMTVEFLRSRGDCCDSGCRHCPYV